MFLPISVRFSFIVSFFILCFGFSLIIFPKPLFAATSCDAVTSFSISPTAGDTNTPFTITGKVANCDSTRLKVFGEVPNTNRAVTARDFVVDMTTNGSGDFTITGARFPENGDWKIQIYSFDSPINGNNNSLSVKIAAGTQKKCGEEAGTGDSSVQFEKLCPSNCPATKQSDGKTWICQLSQGAANTNCNTSVDLNTLPECSTLSNPVLANSSRCGPDNKGYACGDAKQAFCKEGDVVKCSTARISCKADNTCDNNLVPQTITADGKTSCFCVEKGQVVKDQTKPVQKKNCTETNDCSSAAGKYCSNGSLSTAIGCIPTKLNTFINALLVWTAGIAGGIAFLMMIFGSLRMIVSRGNADEIKKGREQFVAAISGLLFIIFSITLLQILGADILAIPGFGR